MDFSEILLILISSAGLLHGLFFAIYLFFFTKRTGANLWLGMLLIFMGIRIGKSVMLYFGTDLEPLFIFAGLSFLLVIGPLLRWYVRAMTRPHFKPKKENFIEFAPFVLVFSSSFFVSNDWFDAHNSAAVAFFASIIIFTYLHLAFYIIWSGVLVFRVKKAYPVAQRTKSQAAMLQWLLILIIGFGIIWVSYVLNIIEDTVPYIVGPIMYSLVIYYLSFKAFQLKTTTTDGGVFLTNTDASLFQQIETLVRERKLYLDAELSLVTLGQYIEKSPQKTSEVVNQYAKRNFNDFINYYRIQEAKEKLLDVNTQKYTISAIAFDCGFSSLSSFNSAFKKFEGTTPSSFRRSASLT